MALNSNCRTARSKTGAFTLVELLVVIAIIGILVSLLLPAVQAAREAARRTECVNNLKQLALAALGYEDQMKVLPAAGIAAPTQSTWDPRTGKMFSWIVLTLPFMEEQAIYDEFDFDQDILNQPRDPYSRHIDKLICPSDEVPSGTYSHGTYTNNKQFAKGNYAAYSSPEHLELMYWFPGALDATRPRPISDLSMDGVSNTVMISEVRKRAHEQDQRGVWALPWNGASLLAFDMHSMDRNSGQTDGGAPTPTTGTNYFPSDASLGLTQPPNNAGANRDILYECPDAAQAAVIGMHCDSYASSRWLSAAPRSRHPGGVQIAFADGHVIFIPNSIDEKTFALMISITDGTSFLMPN